MFSKEESNDAEKFNVIKIRLIQTADNSTVLYAEVGQDFVDLIFGLLGFPLGSMIKCYYMVSGPQMDVLIIFTEV
jgi:hypothetical protein